MCLIRGKEGQCLFWLRIRLQVVLAGHDMSRSSKQRGRSHHRISRDGLVLIVTHRDLPASLRDPSQLEKV